MKGRFFFFLFGVPFACVGIVMGYFSINMLCRSYEMNSWNEVEAKLESVNLDSHRGRKGGATYEVKATYTYLIENHLYRSTRISLGFGKDNVGSFQQRMFRELNSYYQKRKPYKAYVNPNDPNDAILYRKIRWELVAFYQLFFSIFSVVGFGIISAATYGGAKQKREEELKKLYSNEPWLHKEEWKEKRIPSNTKTKLIWSTLIAILWNTVSIPIVFAVSNELELKNYWASWFLISPLFGILLIYYAIRTYFRWKRFGKAVFELDTLPCFIGQKLKGRILTGAMVNENVDFLLKLTCTEVVRTGRGKNKQTKKKILHEETKNVEYQPGAYMGDQSYINVAFDIPLATRPTTDDGSSYQINWKLEAKTSLSGADFVADFEVPVFMPVR